MSIFSTFSSTSRRRAGQQLALVAMTVLTTACGISDVCFNGSEVALGKKPPPSEQQFTLPTQPPATATATGTTAAPKASGTAAASATSAAAAIGGTIKLGDDHPPFMQPWGVGGNSVAFVCGAVTGGPTALTIEFSGTAGQPPSLIVPVGPDGKFKAPFPIFQFGDLGAKVTQAQTASGPRPVTGIEAPPFKVQAAEVDCTP